MMKNRDQSVEKNHNQNWPYFLDHPYIILIIGGSGSGKTNLSLNLIKHQQPYINKFIYTSKIHSNQSINCLLMEEKSMNSNIKKSKSIH